MDYSSGHIKVPVPFPFNTNANAKRTLNAQYANDERFKYGRWTHAKWTMNSRETDDEQRKTELLNTVLNANATDVNERKRHGKLMQLKANAREHKHIGTQTQRNSNATERKRNAPQTFLQRKCNGMQTQTERELFKDRYCNTAYMPYMALKWSRQLWTVQMALKRSRSYESVNDIYVRKYNSASYVVMGWIQNGILYIRYRSNSPKWQWSTAKYLHTQTLHCTIAKIFPNFC